MKFASLAAAQRAAILFIAAAGASLVLGCSANPGIQTADRMIDSLQACVDLMKSVADEASAREAAADIKPVYDEMLAAFQASIAYEQEHGMVRGSQRKIKSIQEDLQRLQTELASENERLDGLQGLPAEFWTPFRLESYRFLRFTLSVANNPLAADPAVISAIDQLASMCEQHGADKLIELTLVNNAGGNVEAAVARLRELAGPAGQVVDFPNPEAFAEHLVGIAPIDDFDQFLATLDIGTIVDQEKARCEATIQLNPIDLSAPSVDSGAADVSSDEGVAEPDAADDEALAEADPGYDAQLGAYRTAPDGRDYGGLETAEPVPEEPPIPEPPQPDDPDYYAQLAELLFDPQAPHHEFAVTTLMEADPAAVTDKKVRARIAQGYRFVAFETEGHIDEAAIGLAVWGGKFSEPLLLELLEREDNQADLSILEALARLATLEGAEAITAHIKDESLAAHVGLAYLREFGPVAEEPIMRLLPFEEAESNLLAIDVLADIGTKKCMAMLRRAAKSENPEVKEAALDALRTIQARGRSDQSSAPRTRPSRPAAARGRQTAAPRTAAAAVVESMGAADPGPTDVRRNLGVTFPRNSC